MTSLVEQPVVLAVGAHPASVEPLCAGTLALLRQKGWRVVLAALTAGDSAAGADRDSALSGLRRQEIRDAASLLDAESVCLGDSDSPVVYGDEACRRVTALLRAVRPALVLTHGPHDALPDHEETSRLLRQACLAAPRKDYRTRDGASGASEPTGRIAHLYYSDPFELVDCFGRRVDAGLIVDIATTVDAKERMLAQYVRHAAEPLTSSGVDWCLEEVRAWGRRRGEQVGRVSGEGFRQHLAPPFPRDDLLREVLGEQVCLVG